MGDLDNGNKTEKYKNWLNKTVDIYINKFEGNAENLKTLINILKFDNILLIIDFLDKEHVVFQKFEELDLKFTTSFSTKNSPYVEALVMVPNNVICNILEEIVNCDPEVIFFFNIKNMDDWERYLYHIGLFKGNKLLKQKLTDVCVCVAFDEKETTISLNSKVYDVAEICTKLREHF
ncbi:MAG: hypothetical protein K0R18_2259 [Bacillales bacterium]|jgi:hypothetical protein|nr:hypothetical protein [Bacillales bacterium]